MTKKIQKDGWIELNLPWDSYDSVINFSKKTIKEFEKANPEPDLTQECLEKFKTTPELEKKKISAKSIKKYNSIRTDILLGELSADYTSRKQKFYDTIKADPELQKVADYDNLLSDYSEWQWAHPDYIKWMDKKEKYVTKKADSKYPSFIRLGLNKPGTLIEVLIDNEPKQYLIGHINKIKGTCNDCTAFGDKTIVKRYKIIWEE